MSRHAPTAVSLGAACAALWYDPRAIGRAIWRHGYPAGTHDGWRTCPAPGIELIEVGGVGRVVCAEHARQIRAALAAGLAGQLRWRH